MSNRNKQIEEHLKGVPLFSEVTPRHRRAVAKLGKVYNWKAGQERIKQGSRAAAFYLILGGSVDVVRNGSPIARLGVGDFFGEMALLSGGTRSASVVASTDCELFGFSRPAFAAAVQSEPDLALKLLAAMASRQNAMI